MTRQTCKGMSFHFLLHFYQWGHNSKNCLIEKNNFLEQDCTLEHSPKHEYQTMQHDILSLDVS